MIKDALAGEPILLDNGCDVPLPWVYIDDVTAALQAAIEAPRENIRETDLLAYNVTGPGYPTFREIAEIVQEFVPGAVIEDTYVADKYAMNARKMCLAAITRDLQWTPQVTIHDGVQKLFAALSPAELCTK
jgi:nucleoside-diphosphate-sugar epimerase